MTSPQTRALVWMIMAGLVFAPGWWTPYASMKWIMAGLPLLWLLWRGRAPVDAFPRGLLVVGLVCVFFIRDTHAATAALLPLSVIFLAVSVPLLPQEQDLVRKALGWIGLLGAGYLVLQHLGLDPISYQKALPPGSFWGNPNFAGHVLLLCLVLGKYPDRWCVAAFAVLVFAMALTQSRGVLGCLMLYTLYKSHGLVRRWFLTTSACLLLALVSLLAVFRSDVREGIYWISHPQAWATAEQAQPSIFAERDPWFRDKRRSVMTRVILIANTSAMIADATLTGRGPGQFRSYYAGYGTAVVPDINMSRHYRSDSPHNFLLEGAVAFGLIWLLLLLGWLASLIRLGLKQDQGWVVALVLQLLLGLVSLNYLNPVILVSLALLMPRDPSAGTGARNGYLLCLIPFVVGAYAHGLSLWKPSPYDQAVQFYQAGKPVEAWPHIVRAWEADPEGPETLYVMGEIAAARGNWDIAARLWALCAAYHPFYSHARVALEDAAGVEMAQEMIQHATRNRQTYMGDPWDWFP